MTDNQRKAKQMLMVVKNFDIEIRKQRDKLDSMRVMVEGGAIRYDKEHIISTPVNYTEEILVDIADLDAEIEEKIASFDEYRVNAYRSVKSIESIEGQTVLFYYYFDGYTYDNTAAILNKSKGTIYELEDTALEQLGMLLSTKQYEAVRYSTNT